MTTLGSGCRLQDKEGIFLELVQNSLRERLSVQGSQVGIRDMKSHEDKLKCSADSAWSTCLEHVRQDGSLVLVTLLSFRYRCQRCQGDKCFDGDEVYQWGIHE